MGRLTTILQCQWRAYWRQLARPGSLRTGNQGILLILSILILVRYASALKVAGAELASGKTRMLDRLLMGIFIAWLFPLMNTARLRIATSALRQLPLTVKDLLIIKVGSLFIPPFAWMILAGSLAIGFPLLKAPNPIAGIVAALLFIFTSWLIGLTVAHLMSIAVWRKILVAVLLIAAAVIAYYASQVSNRLSLLQLLPFTPWKLVVNAAIGQRVWATFGMLLVLPLLAAGTTLWSFQASLNHSDSSSAQKAQRITLFFGKAGPLSGKDFRYFRRLLDPYLGLLASAVGCIYLVSADEPTAEVFWIFIILAFFPGAAIAFNSFGLDNRNGLDRYALLPLTGKEIIWSKNVAFLALACLALGPMFVFAIVRLGIVAVGLGVIEASLLALAFLTWGNFVSVSHRVQMEFYHFSSGGPPIDALVGVIFGCLPGAIAIQLFGQSQWWLVGLMLILYFTMYLASISWSGRKFDRVTL